MVMGHWVASFHDAFSGQLFESEASDMTVRVIVPNNLNGTKIRLCLSNEYSGAALQIGEVWVAVCNAHGEGLGQSRRLTVKGKTAVVLQAGEVAYTDETDYVLTAGEYVAMTMYFPKGTVIRSGSLLYSYLPSTRSGNHCQEEWKHAPAELSIIALKRLDVYTDGKPCVISAFGDSITAGCSWYTPLRQRLYREYPTRVAMGNTGICGNRLLSDSPVMYQNWFGNAGVSRFGQDVLSVPGISHCIFALGTNDIGYLGTNLDDQNQPLKPQMVVRALELLVSRAREKGVRCIYMPVFPRRDADFIEEKERMRRMVNEEVKRQGFFDEIMEMDSVLSDSKSGNIKAEYVQEDGLHLNEEGGLAVERKICSSLI